MNNKYSKILTAILVVLIIGIVGLLAFFGIDIYNKLYGDKEASEMLDEYDDYLKRNDTMYIDNSEAPELDANLLGNDMLAGDDITSSNGKFTYKGYDVIGKIEIPKTKVKYPILENTTKNTIEIAIARLYGAYPNEVGNMVLVSHNFRDGRLFSNNKKLTNGDKIYITDNSGKRVEYEIYNIYVTDREDFDYATRDTQGKREISLSTCTDDVKQVLIIWAREV